MSYSIDQNLCIGCGTCTEVCPTKAIASNNVAAIDDSLCILCGICQVSCPQKAVLHDGKPYQPEPSPPGTGSGEMLPGCCC